MRRNLFVAALVILCGSCHEEAELLTPFDSGVTADGDGLPSDADGASDAADAGDVNDAGSGFSASVVSAGDFHACAVSNTKLYCWGDGNEGQLGDGNQEDRTRPTAVNTDSAFSHVSAGHLHSCGVTSDGQVYCWGGNASGQLGTGDYTARTSPARVELPGPAREVQTRFDVTCALLSDQSLWCWGDNFEGQLGQNDDYVDTGQSSPFPRRVGDAADWTTVSAGQGHVCGIRAPGALWCWGRNSTSELGLGPGQPIQLRFPQRVGSSEDWMAVSSGQNHTCGLRADGSAWCWGNGDHGQLGLGNTDVRLEPTEVGMARDFRALSTNTFATCAVRGAAQELWCWGRNIEGQLGLGNMSGQGEFMSQPLPQSVAPGFSSVAAGRMFTCARAVDGSVACTGGNSEGELGVGDELPRSSFTSVRVEP